MRPVEDMPPSACRWCRHTHPVDAPHISDPVTEPGTPEDTNGDTP